MGDFAHQTIFGKMMVVTAWGGESGCCWHLMGRDVCNHPTIYKKDSYNKDLSDPRFSVIPRLRKLGLG